MPPCKKYRKALMKMNVFREIILTIVGYHRLCRRGRKRIASAFFCVLLALGLTACGGGATGETAFTAAQGPADSALPYQVVFSVSEHADERLLAAAQNFCDRTAEFSQGGAVFRLVTSENPLQDLKVGNADAILLESADTDAFSPITESFRYKGYEHFAMTANADTVLQILSDILGANAFAGFYAGSDVFLSHGTLDAKFRPLPSKDAEDARESQTIAVSARCGSTARAFAPLNVGTSATKDLDARIRAVSSPNAVVEFSYAELSPALLATFHKTIAEAAPLAESTGTSEESDKADAETGTPATPEPLTATPAFTEIRPVWLVFAPDVYEKLSQTNRAAVAEAAAYMVTDIDGVYLAQERELLGFLSTEDIDVSDDFSATRTLALRFADAQAANLTGTERKLRDAVANIQ